MTTKVFNFDPETTTAFKITTGTYLCPTNKYSRVSGLLLSDTTITVDGVVLAESFGPSVYIQTINNLGHTIPSGRKFVGNFYMDSASSVVTSLIINTSTIFSAFISTNQIHIPIVASNLDVIKSNTGTGYILGELFRQSSIGEKTLNDFWISSGSTVTASNGAILHINEYSR